MHQVTGPPQAIETRTELVAFIMPLFPAVAAPVPDRMARAALESPAGARRMLSRTEGRMNTARTTVVSPCREVPAGQRLITFFVPESQAQELVAAAELEGRSLGSYIRTRLFLGPQTTPPQAAAAIASRNRKR